MKYKLLVTCATGDIGTALCLSLARQGHDLVITARDIDRLKKLAGTIRALYPHPSIEYHSADLGIRSSMSELISTCSEKGLDGIVLMPPRPGVLPANATAEEHAQVLTKVMQDSLQRFPAKPESAVNKAF